jgi:hypothetical protein
MWKNLSEIWIDDWDPEISNRDCFAIELRRLPRTSQNLAPIWFPHCPPWMWTISLMTETDDYDLNEFEFYRCKYSLVWGRNMPRTNWVVVILNDFKKGRVAFFRTHFPPSPTNNNFNWKCRWWEVKVEYGQNRGLQGCRHNLTKMKQWIPLMCGHSNTLK